MYKADFDRQGYSDVVMKIAGEKITRRVSESDSTTLLKQANARTHR
jgi:hypothetical protein